MDVLRLLIRWEEGGVNYPRDGVMCSKAETAQPSSLGRQALILTSVRYLGSPLCSEMHLGSSFPFISGKEHRDHELRIVGGPWSQKMPHPAQFRKQDQPSQPKPPFRGRIEPSQLGSGFFPLPSEFASKAVGLMRVASGPFGPFGPFEVGSSWQASSGSG